MLEKNEEMFIIFTIWGSMPASFERWRACSSPQPDAATRRACLKHSSLLSLLGHVAGDFQEPSRPAGIIPQRHDETG